MYDLLVKDALIVTCNPEHSVIDGAVMAVRDGKIALIAPAPSDAANALEREQLRRAAEREASRHRLARTLESELKAIAGAMDDREIQSMWDSHPTLDSIRRRRRGAYFLALTCRIPWSLALCAAMTSYLSTTKDLY